MKHYTHLKYTLTVIESTGTRNAHDMVRWELVLNANDPGRAQAAAEWEALKHRKIDALTLGS